MPQYVISRVNPRSLWCWPQGSRATEHTVTWVGCICVQLLGRDFLLNPESSALSFVDICHVTATLSLKTQINYMMPTFITFQRCVEKWFVNYSDVCNGVCLRTRHSFNHARTVVFAQGKTENVAHVLRVLLLFGNFLWGPLYKRGRSGVLISRIPLIPVVCIPYSYNASY